MAIRGPCLSAHYTPCVPVFRVKASSFVLPALSLARSVGRECARALTRAHPNRHTEGHSVRSRAETGARIQPSNVVIRTEADV